MIQTLGDYHQLLSGLRDFVEVLKGVNSSESKKAQSDLEYALWKCVESRAGGKLDPKDSGMDQINGRGVISPHNCSKVTEALRGMYQQDDEIQEWLDNNTLKWEALTAAISNVRCFLKSQKKRPPGFAKINCLCFCIDGKMHSQVRNLKIFMGCFAPFETLFICMK